LHVVEMGGDLWDHGLVFRDHLRASLETARGYARLEHYLADRFRDDRGAYAEAKTGFVSAAVEQRAKASRASSRERTGEWP
jgi:GrpB-like predicted nucleotidyltransferase (UPF0157 family)